MSNLGNSDIGDGIRIQTVLTNLSSVVADATDVRVSILDDADVKLINQSVMTKTSTGTYICDIFIDPDIFSAGLHRVIFTAYSTNISENTSSYDSNVLYIEENRLV